MNPRQWWRARRAAVEAERQRRLALYEEWLAERYEVRVVFAVSTKLSDHVQVVGPVGHPNTGGPGIPSFWDPARARAYKLATTFARKGIWLTERQLIAPSLIATVFVRQLPNATKP